MRFDTDQKTALNQLKDNSVLNKRALELVQKAGEDPHLERIKLSETAQKKRIERRTTEYRKNTDKDERKKKRYRQ